MALITINGVTPANPKAYAVTTRKITKEVQNSKQDTFIDLVNRKASIDIAWGCLPQEQQSEIEAAIYPVSFQVTYTDQKGDLKTGTFKSNDPKYNMLVYIDGSPVWADLAITLTEL